MKVKDLPRDDYVEYTLATSSINSDYSSTFWIFAILTTVFTISIAVEGVTVGSVIGLIICVFGLLLNYFSTLAKYVHVAKLFNLEKGFSLLK